MKTIEDHALDVRSIKERNNENGLGEIYIYIYIASCRRNTVLSKDSN